MVLIVLAVVAGLLVVGCLACGGLTYFGFNSAMGILASTAEEQYSDHPVVEEHIGDIESIAFNVVGTGQINEEMGEEYLVFDVQGTKGEGRLLLKQTPGSQRFSGGILRTDQGDFDLDEKDAEMEETPADPAEEPETEPANPENEPATQPVVP